VLEASLAGGQRPRKGVAQFRVQFRHRPTGKTVQFHPMGRSAALDVARQLVFDAETEVLIIDDAGLAWTVSAFSGRPA
jgi:hypothetical protein